MKSKIQWIVSLLVLVTMCSCGVSPSGQDKAREQEEIEKTAIVESAVFKNSDTTVKEKRFDNDYIRIWQYERENEYDEYDEWDFLWMQENLDGTGRRTVEIDNLYNLLWLTNEWLYYVISTDDYEKGFVCRSPLMDKQTFSYDAEQAETLWEIEDFSSAFEYPSNFFVTDSYIFYGYLHDNEVVFYRYDVSSGQSAEVFTIKKDIAVIVLDRVTNLPVTLKDTFFIAGEDGIYRVSFDTLQTEKIYSGEYSDSDVTDMVESDDCVYFCSDVVDGTSMNELLKYDGESGEVSCVLDKNALLKLFDEMQLRDEDAGKKDGYVYRLYIYEKKLYMQVMLNWVSGPVEIVEGPLKGETDSIYHNRDVLLSAELSDLTHWEVVQPLADYILDNAASYAYIVSSGKMLYKADASSTVDRDGYIAAMDDGVVYFYMKTKEDEKDVWSAYDVDTGEIRQIDEKDTWHWFYWVL